MKEYIPEIDTKHIQKNIASGVRALALETNGNLVDDFVVESNDSWKSVLHVRNAPSPAATSSLALGRVIANMAERQFNWKNE